MKTDNRVSNIIKKRFIDPIAKDTGHYVGVEIELPIVNLNRKAVDFDVVHKVTEEFVKDNNFAEVIRDDNGFIYDATQQESGDKMSYDCSYNTLEFSFSKEKDIHIVSERFYRYIDDIQNKFRPYDHVVTGMGINPGYRFNINEPIACGRYKMLYAFLKSYKQFDSDSEIPFHNYPNYGMFSAASQIQLDVDTDNVLKAINVFNKLEPLKALLFANSVWKENTDILINRDWLWVNSLHGFNPHNVGLLRDNLTSIDDLIDYIASMSMYCCEREGHYLYFHPMTATEYFNRDKVTGYYHDEDGRHRIVFKPTDDDIQYLRSFKYVDLTFRGTLELRSVCTQPIYETFAPAAFHAGIIEMLDEVDELLDSSIIYKDGMSPYILRELLGRRSIPAFLDTEEVSSLLNDVINLAREGLYKRGFHEESFLDPLYRRATFLTNPAKEIRQSKIKHYIIKYSKTKHRIAKGIRDDFYYRSGIGLEEESLRVKPDGFIATTPHPFKDRKDIDRDFSEAQVEIVTPICYTPESLHEKLCSIRREVVEKLWNEDDRRELLWPFSNPPYIQATQEIPIAKFYGEANWKTKYRNYLGEKYGRHKMLLSGIHFNFSYPEYYLRATFEQDARSKYREFINHRYLALAEKAAAYSWLVVALTAASPIHDGSYWDVNKKGQQGLSGYSSLRCSEHGYWNDFIPTFDYRDVDGYIASVKKYIDKGLIREERELYYPIRVKPSGRFRIEELGTKGINHIEFRMVDLNPLYEGQIALSDIQFMLLFFEWLEHKPPIYADDEMQKEFVRNIIRASHMPLENQTVITFDKREVNLIDEALTILEDMKSYIGNNKVIAIQEEKLRHPEKRYAERIIEKFNSDYVGEGIKYATKQAERRVELTKLESMDGMFI